MRQLEPENVHGWRSLDRLETRQLAHLGKSAVGSDGEQGAEFVPAIGALIAHAAHSTVLLDEFDDIGHHAEAKIRILLCFASDEVQKLLLWDQKNIGKLCLQPAKVDGRK